MGFLIRRNSSKSLTRPLSASCTLISRAAPPTNEPDLLADIASLFVDDSFAAEVDAYIQAERQRERDEAVEVANGGNAAVMPSGLSRTSVPPSR